jgi:hypothetical protein
MSDFEREIEHELHRALDSAMAGTIPAWRVPRPRSFARRLLGGAGVAIGVKVLTGIAVAAAAATVAGAATETVITGSVDPSVWGQQVKLQVDACKDRLSAGRHGIGDCVSDFTTKHEETTTTESQQTRAVGETKSPGVKKPAPPAAPDRKNPRPQDLRQHPSASPTQGGDHQWPGRSGSFTFVRPTPRPPS